MKSASLTTRYKKQLFRSRLEARWARFFDALPVSWQYEPQTFDLKSCRYTPDFFLPRFSIWIEVKPNIQEVRAGLDKASLFVQETGYPLWFLTEVGTKSYARVYPGMDGPMFLTGDEYFCGFAACDNCGKVDWCTGDFFRCEQCYGKPLFSWRRIAVASNVAMMEEFS